MFLTSDLLLWGLLATVIAAMQLVGWAALGAAVWRPAPDAVPAAARMAVAILVGSGMTAAAASVFAYAGMIPAALFTVAGVPLVALSFQGSAVASMVRSVLGDVRTSLGGHRMRQGLVAALCAVYWANAAVPPRDGDVMRYHLGHVRRILLDGVWIPRADFHDALPFGWSLNYLPFEAAGIPEATHFLNLGIWLIVLAGLLGALPREPRSPAAWLTVLVLALQPTVVKVVTTAHADAYSMFAVFASAAMLMRLSEGCGAASSGLGFAAWIGAQSRYQLVAVGAAVTVAVLVLGLRRHIERQHLWRFFAGAAAAAALSAPFYLVNQVFLGNPVWPLMIPWFNHAPSYGDRIAAAYQHGLTGDYSLAFIGDRAAALLTNMEVFPIPLLTVAVLAVAHWSDRRPLRYLACFGAVFCLLWVALQPYLYPRFSVFLVPAVAIAAVALVSLDRATPFRWALSAGLTAAAIGFTGFVAWYSSDAARYLITGDGARFHQSTWYYSTFSWINEHTPQEARVLAIVNSGHSYYLRRRHAKADPDLSGVVDWESVRTDDDLMAVLERGSFDYVVYDDRDWSASPGGAQMSRAVAHAIERGRLQVAHRFEERLVTSRIRRQSIPATVLLLQRDGQSPPPPESTGTSSSPLPRAQSAHTT